MGKIGKFINKKIAILSLALSKVEKNALNQTGELLSSDTEAVSRHTIGQLADSLLNGVITQEVENLRWRTIKILESSKELTTSTERLEYDENGHPIIQVKKRSGSYSKALKNVKFDEIGSYPLEMVIVNSKINNGSSETFDNISDDSLTLRETFFDKNIGEDVISFGQVKAAEAVVSTKSDNKINIVRNEIPSFFLENYITKLLVRTMPNEVKLLDCYVSEYPDIYDRKSRLFLSEIKKIMQDGKRSNILYFDKINFISENDIGINDDLFFEFGNIEFDSVIKFNGHFVIKFKSTLLESSAINEKYRVTSLDQKYIEKSKK